MPQIPFLTASYAGRSTNVDASRCVNLFPEIPQSPFTKAPITLVGCPGTTEYLDFGTQPIRGSHVFAGLLYTVTGGAVYASDVNGTKSAVLFTLNTTVGKVRIVDNGLASNGVGGNQMLIVDGLFGYLYNFATSTMLRSDSFTGANSTGPTAFPVKPTQVTYQDGYFIVSNETMNIYCSDLYDGSSWGGLAYAGAIAASDTVQVPFSLHQELYVIKEYTTEIFYNAGVPTTQGCPFVRRSGAVMGFGTPAPWSVARGADSLFFLANIRSGDIGEFMGIVQVSGYNPEVISTESINYRISKFYLFDAFGYCYSAEGHQFYVLTFPTDNVTFVYDAVVKMWHERSTYVDGSIYQVNRHFSECYVKYAEKHIVSDYLSGKLFELSTDYFDDDGLPLISYVVSPYTYDKNEMENTFIAKLIVDAETGFNNELVVLSWSDDGGHTWSNEYQASIGATGAYGTRLVWRRLGRSRNKIFRLAMPGAHKKVLINAFIEGSV